MVIPFILLIAAAYFIGSIPTAYLVAKWRRGIDIRQYGSGNVGASNVMAVVSKRWSIAVSIFDIGKGALMVWLAQLFGLGAAQQAIIGIAAIIGHNWTVFLHFQGGRGIFTSLGVIAMLAPRVGLIALILPYLFAPFRQLSLGVTITLTILPIISWLLSQPLAVGEPVAVSLGYLAILLTALFRRLTAPKTPLGASVPRGELIINRLLFDRDIKDREAWLRQIHPETKARR
ncbi:MAG: glycerol-3-phosphate acyltransferase [Chloroflexota bacterium]